jgi:hypothetical protein
MKPDRTSPRRLRWRTVTPLLFALPLLLGGVAACGAKNSGDGVASVNGTGGAPASASVAPSMDDQEKLLQFTKCLREHGLNVQDPGPDGRPKIDPNTDPTKQKAALDACRQYAPGALANGYLSQEDKAAMLAYIQCLREHGITINDPDPNTGMPQRSDIMKFRNPDPAMQKAMDACKDKRPQGFGNH